MSNDERTIGGIGNGQLGISAARSRDLVFIRGRRPIWSLGRLRAAQSWHGVTANATSEVANRLRTNGRLLRQRALLRLDFLLVDPAPLAADDPHPIHQ